MIEFVKEKIRCFFNSNDKIIDELAKLQKAYLESTQKTIDIANYYKEIIKGKDRIYNNVMHTIPAYVWSKDVQGHYLQINEKMRVDFFYDFPLIELLGKTDLEIKAMIIDKYGADKHTFGEVCGDSDKITIENRRETKFNEFGLINGKFKRIIVHKNPCFSVTGKVEYTVGYGYDITEDYARMEAIINDSRDLEEMKKALRIELDRDLFVPNMTCEVK